MTTSSIKLSENVIKIISDSNVYIIENKIIIDTARDELKAEIKKEIEKYVDPKNIKTVILTHLHYDHIGNADLFTNATFYANEIAEKDCQIPQKKLNQMLHATTANKFQKQIKNIYNNKELTKKFQIQNTPGHSSSCIILHYKKDNILFTGDTYFAPNIYGRTDLPTSEPEKLQQSINTIKEIIKTHNPTIAPGHGY